MTREAVTTEAVVLRTVAYREADLIVTIYTRDRGRLSALARSARKSRKRFGACLGLFTVSRVDLTSRRSAELWTMASAQLVRTFGTLASDMACYAHASYGTELARELTPVEVPDERVFDLLIELYNELESRGASVTMLRAFELQMLELVGLAPVLDRCVGCERGDIDSRGTVLDPARGGVCCSSCAAFARTVGVRPLSSGARRVMLAAQSARTLAAARELGAGPEKSPAPTAAHLAEARDCLVSLILGHVGKPLRSLEFIAKVSGAAQARRRES